MIRRDFLGSLTAAPLLPQAGSPLPSRGDDTVAISEYQPRSMLAVTETKVARPSFPVIDVHTHLTGSNGETTHLRVPVAELLPVMAEVNVRMLVNVTGGYGAGLRSAITTLDRAHPGRFRTMVEPVWDRANETGYAKRQADWLATAKRDGAVGLKILKTLGLFLRDTGGKLVTVDDSRFDPMWDACAQLDLPVSIHVSDPVAFFLPIDRFNERYEELHQHPNWSFYGKDYPHHQEILAAQNRVFAKHPKTRFMVLHVGNHAENLADVSQMLDRFPNTSVELAARIGELGRQPRAARKFFDRYQDRIMLGTDATPNGRSTPQQFFCADLYRIYARFLETEDEYFDYAPASIPPQGRWRIYGIGLPEPALRKVYFENAMRWFGLKA